MKGEAKAKVSEPGGQERVTDENGDFGGRYRASEAERYSRKSGVNVPDSTAMRDQADARRDPDAIVQLYRVRPKNTAQQSALHNENIALRTR